MNFDLFYVALWALEGTTVHFVNVLHRIASLVGGPAVSFGEVSLCILCVFYFGLRALGGPPVYFVQVWTHL